MWHVKCLIDFVILQVLLLQTVHSVSMTQDYIDLRMRSDLLWDGELIGNEPEVYNPTSLKEIGGKANKKLSLSATCYSIFC